MLSQAAFNAFLKTLEEPPPYAKFILATTEKHKIIPTILSRCQIFDFKRIQIKDIVVQLKDIAEKENKNISDDALHLIAQKADGAMRDGLSIYDKIISSVEGDIEYKDVADNLNVLDYEFYFKIVDGAIKEDMTEVMLINNDIIRKGFESEQFVLGLMNHLRDLLMVKDVRTAEILDIADGIKKRYADQAALASSSFLLSALNVLNDTSINLPRSQNKRLSVEIALGKMCYLNRIIDKKKTDDLTVESTSQSEKKSQQPPTHQIAQKPTQSDVSPTHPPELTEKPAPIQKAQESNAPSTPKQDKTEVETKSPSQVDSKPSEVMPTKIKAPTLSANLDTLMNLSLIHI